jgi:hypothetical protein
MEESFQGRGKAGGCEFRVEKVVGFHLALSRLRALHLGQGVSKIEVLRHCV